MSKKILIAALIVKLCAIAVGVAAASGVIISKTDEEIHFDELNIIYVVDRKAGLVTVRIVAHYVSAADEFVWVIPVPSEPEVEFLDFFDKSGNLHSDTELRFEAPPNDICGYLYSPADTSGHPFDFNTDNPTPTDYILLRGDTISDWLTDNGYQLADEARSIMQDYSAQGMNFVVLPLQQRPDALSGQIDPIRLTYSSDMLTMPIHNDSTLPVTIWIIADSQYVPGNFARPPVDYSAIRAPNTISNVELYYDGIGAVYARESYPFVRSDALRDAGGQAFITEYAQPSTDLLAEVQERGFLDHIADLPDSLPYITRLYGEIPPEQMALSPIFIPAPDEPDVSNVIDLNGIIDPLHFWGCSTRTASSRVSSATYDDLQADLPSGRTIVNLLNLAHPENWVLSEFAINRTHISAFAPQAVDETTFNAYMNGDDTPPMFISWQGPSLIDIFDYDLSEELSIPEDLLPLSNGRIIPRPDGFGGRAIFLALLTSDEDWEANSATYRAMLNYPLTYQYWLHPDLRHTLFMNVANEVAYPDGWVEKLVENNEIHIAPADDQNASHLRLIPTPHIYQTDDFLTAPERAQRLANWINVEYGLDESEVYDSIIAAVERSESDCHTHFSMFLTPIPFSNAGRTGYLRAVRGYMVEISGPIAVFDQIEETLRVMAEAMIVRPIGCG